MATHRFQLGDGEAEPIAVETTRGASGTHVRIEDRELIADVLDAATGAVRLSGGEDDHLATVERMHAVVDGDDVLVWWRGRSWRLPVHQAGARRAGGGAAAAAAGDEISAPMPGSVLDVKVAAGDTVSEGDVVVVMESMKMEMSLPAPRDAVIAEVNVATGDMVELGQTLVRFEPADD